MTKLVHINPAIQHCSFAIESDYTTMCLLVDARLGPHWQLSQLQVLRL